MTADSPLEPLLIAADRALRAVFASPQPGRPTPAPKSGSSPAAPLSAEQKREAAALMRVNHTGEVAAQALYHGQAMLARDPETRAMLLKAAREEEDHLAWCAQRIQELGGRTSVLNPLFYAGSWVVL